MMPALLPWPVLRRLFAGALRDNLAPPLRPLHVASGEELDAPDPFNEACAARYLRRYAIYRRRVDRGEDGYESRRLRERQHAGHAHHIALQCSGKVWRAPF